MENMKEINLAEIMSALLRKLWLIVLCAVIGGALSYGYTARFITPLYKSRITVYVNNAVQYADRNDVAISATDLATSQRLVSTYINILKSDFVLDEVAKNVGASSAAEIRSMMTSAALEETEVFEVVITNSSKQKAKQIAEEIAKVAPGKIQTIVEGSSTKIIDQPKLATAPSSPNKTTNTLYGLIIGSVAAIVVIVLQTLLDVRVKGEEDLAMISTAPVLGLIPDLAIESKDRYGYSGYKYSAYSYKANQNSKNGEAGS